MANDLDPFDEYGDDVNETEAIREPRSAKSVLQVIKDSEKEFSRWQTKCDRIDKLYSSLQSLSGFGVGGDGHLMDREYNLFWASVEVIKPSIYSRPPVPVVAPKFKDRSPVKRVTSELLERTCIAGFDTSDIDQVMLGVRDDLVINARGVIWLSYESVADSDTDSEKVCIEHLDRYDFGHEWARKWSEVGMVWRHAWLTKGEARKRFRRTSGNEYQNASYSKNKDELGEGNRTNKARFTEVWNKRANKVQWVAEGCEVFLDEDEPHLKLTGFFPCPRPAYATMERRSLIPVPDISYIKDQLETINELTVRIHDLCDKLVVKGIIPAGTEVGDAIEKAMRETSSSYLLIPVPSMSMGDGTSNQVQWLPIDMVAQAILSAVEARREIIGNVQELFGIADIMRGDTQANETLGAQQLKAQFGSVRIRDRVNELVRIARDTVRIMAEIQAEEFDFDTLLDMSQMELPTEADIKEQLATIKEQARKELEALADKAEMLAASPEAQENPEAAQAQFQQAQQQIIGKYAPQIEKLSQSVTIEAVKDMLRDNKTRPFAFDIETDSTIYPDEQAEKASRNEFLTALAGGVQALMPMVQSGGAKAAGDVLKFVLGPYRAGRELEGSIDEWIENLQNMPAQQNGANDAEKALADAQSKLAAAEIEKAKAATMSVEARAATETQKLQAKMMELQQKAANDQQKAELEVGTLQGKLAEQDAKINLMQAQTAEILSKIGLDVRKQDLEEYKAATETEMKATDQAMRAEGQSFSQAQQLAAPQEATDAP